MIAEISADLSHIRNELQGIGYSSTEIDELITYMYYCKTYSRIMDITLSYVTQNQRIRDMYDFQKVEIDAIIPYLDNTLYPEGEGSTYENALLYSNIELNYDSAVLTYTA